MDIKGLAEFLSIVDKLQIEKDNRLTRVEKEFFKECVDEAKRQLQKSLKNN